jgi:2-keto-3-deoxy-L-rhamnonate aldolase RhmA
MRKNKLKEVISRGDVAIGTCIYSFSPAIIEVAGFAGLDFCRVDNEHAWRQDETVENVLRGAYCAEIVPLLRVDRDNPHLVRKALEAGAGGVIVPHIDTREEAEALVHAGKFPPLGERGYGGLCFSAKWGLNGGLDWMEWSNDETLIIPMIESVKAVSNIDDIMSTKGVDAVFFGPADFSISAGIPLQTGHEKVTAALKTVVASAKKHGKFVVTTTGFPYKESVLRMMEMGVQAIEIGHDVTILSTIWKKTINETRGK